jgi:hypothetical protein
VPSQTYLYLPVGTPEMLGFAEDWNAGLRGRDQPECPVISNDSSGFTKAVRRLSGRGMVRFVGTADTLVIITHGASAGLA